VNIASQAEECPASASTVNPMQSGINNKLPSKMYTDVSYYLDCLFT